MNSAKRILCFLLSITLIGGAAQQKIYAANQKTAEQTEIKENDLYAKSAVLMDADSGRILFSKNGQEQRPMASTTKIMTLIVTLENADCNDLVTVSEYAASMPDVQLNIKKGEQYCLRDLLYSLMLESHNDSAVAIAEHIGAVFQKRKQNEKTNREEVVERSREESKKMVLQFAEMMNQKARDIGCCHTFFITPNGLDSSLKKRNPKTGKIEEMIHSTTAEDLARIMSYCITKSPKKEEFLKITGTKTYSFQNVIVDDNGQKTTGNRSFSCNNHNAFLTMMQGAVSGKTGFTAKAGYCYVGAVKDEGRTFVVALLACGWPNNKGYKWQDTRKLMTYGEKRFFYFPFSDVHIDEKVYEPILVSNAKSVHIGENVYVPVEVETPKIQFQNHEGVLLRDDEKMQVTFSKKNMLEAPVAEHSLVGNISYFIGNEKWKQQNICTGKRIERIDLKWCITKVLEKYFI